MKNHFFFDVIPSWIIILMPALLISGPFLSDLGVSVVAILFLVNSKKNNLKKYYNNYYFKFFFIFCLILILSSLISKNILQIVIVKKFTGERGRINCSLRDPSGFWRWLGIQFVISDR